MLCVGPTHQLPTVSPSSHPPHLTKQVSKPGFELNVNRQKKYGKRALRGGDPQPLPGFAACFPATRGSQHRNFPKALCRFQRVGLLISSSVLFQFFRACLVLKNSRRNSEVNKRQDALAEALEGVTLVVSQLETSSDDCFF